MTMYAGDPVRIAPRNPHTKTKPHLTPDDVEKVTVEVFNSDRNEDGDFTTRVVTMTEIPWADDEDNWVFIWDTTGMPFGAYFAYVTIWTLNGLPNVEGPKRIRLKRKRYTA